MLGLSTHSGCAIVVFIVSGVEYVSGLQRGDRVSWSLLFHGTLLSHPHHPDTGIVFAALGAVTGFHLQANVCTNQQARASQPSVEEQNTPISCRRSGASCSCTQLSVELRYTATCFGGLFCFFCIQNPK